MKLLITTPFYKPAYVYGGPPRSISALCQALSELGIDLTVFTTNANGSCKLNVEAGKLIVVDGVKVYYYSREWPGNYYYSRELSRACQTKIPEFDLVYVSSNWVFPFFPASRVARKAGVPYVVAPRTAFMHKTWKGKYLKKCLYHLIFERSLLNDAAAIHYTTELEVRESSWLKLHCPYFVMPNAVSLNEFNHLPARSLFRQKWEIAPDAEMLLFLGRIESRKGLDILLPAFARISKQFQKAKLVLAGPEEDNYRRVLWDMAEKLNINNRLIFTGYLTSSERLEALAAADLFVLTSYSENFGMAVVEAMASGVPVVLSNQVGIADIVDRSKAGLVGDLDVESIAYALSSLLGSEDMRMAFAKNATKAAHEHFAPNKVALAFAGKLMEILARAT